MLFFDVTKASGFKHGSGLSRVSGKLREQLADFDGVSLKEVVWNGRHRSFVEKGGRRPIEPNATDWLLTPELFSEEERPGFTDWLSSRLCRLAAVYHDSIPLRYPEFTWPHSVARHPHYLKLMTRFDVVFAVSDFSANELRGYCRWVGAERVSPVVIPLGADGFGTERAAVDLHHSDRRSIAMIGIVELRKNQVDVLDAAECLWNEGIEFSLTFIGRVNPQFGKPIARRMKSLVRAGRPLIHLPKASDEEVARVLANSRFTLMPSLAEGCGLPVLESLWAGLPVVCSDIASIEESARAGGCLTVPAGAVDQLTGAIRGLLQDDETLVRLANEASSRPLPKWSDAANAVLNAMN